MMMMGDGDSAQKLHNINIQYASVASENITLNQETRNHKEVEAATETSPVGH
jgi:hypothetical protein